VVFLLFVFAFLGGTFLTTINVVLGVTLMFIGIVGIGLEEYLYRKWMLTNK